jgi:hypothetical protein
MSAIFTRHGQYLNERYQWGFIPHLFPEWQFPAVLDLVDGWKDKPTGYAMVKPGVIDLDALEVVRL